jgi:hypothetical protein
MTYRMLMFDNYFRTDRWGISINILYNFSVVYSTERNLFKIHGNTLEWTAPVEHIHGNWPRASCGLSLAI